jgi:hypothetical protein
MGRARVLLHAVRVVVRLVHCDLLGDHGGAVHLSSAVDDAAWVSSLSSHVHDRVLLLLRVISGVPLRGQQASGCDAATSRVLQMRGDY